MTTITTAEQTSALRICDSPEWLLGLLGRGGSGFLEVRYRDVSTQRVRSWFADVTHPAHPSATYDYAQALAERNDVWIGATVRGRRSGKAESVCRANALWADCDHGRDLLDRYPIRPNLIVESGTPGHFQAWWALPEPFELDTPQARAEFRDKLRRLQRAVGSDTVSDLPRVLRCPGCLNWKRVCTPDDDPEMVVPIEFRPGDVAL